MGICYGNWCRPVAAPHVMHMRGYTDGLATVRVLPYPAIISFIILNRQAGYYVTFAGFKVDGWKGVKSDATRLTRVAVETDFGANKFQNPYLNTYIMLYPGERHHIQFLSCVRST